MKCPLCAEHQALTVIEKTPYALIWSEMERQTGVRFSQGVHDENTPATETTLVRCDVCGLLFFWPIAPASTGFYPELVGSSLHYSYSETKWEFDWLLERLPPKQRVLDVGCGRGDFLAKCRQAGHDVVGLEADADAAKHSRARGIEVHEESLELFSERGFDVVTAFHVLEHVADPLTFVRRLAQCAKGPVVISVPNADRTRTGQMEPLDFPPHHVTRWNASSLRSLARLTPLTIETLATEPLDWQTARYTFEKRIARRLGPVGAAAGFLASRALLPSQRLYDAQAISRRLGLAGLAVIAVLKDA
jgi:SAM-dependent methyltransferase